ncbi:sigma-70 family RNA polymerase sigma factor [Planococcus sp. N028]|uniref:Sigma-70 family RNA polymerase sigma factor n=1 Tax=Planococcus shixiaomingii TaxID=3058393 RepID=A0ABT8N116_9BACL|nr:sigma-70 family RNA polymerase sigma factor [Planococcus sp. N028]MDN7241591.1 sigma-70 family RNA polymerase sigma factor [Planococcus sp. N028]
MDQFDKLVEQYAPMISAIIRKLHIYREFEMFRQVGKVALWQAHERFDENKGNFTPFAYRSIYGAMLDELKRESRFTSKVTVMENDNFEWIVDPYIKEEMPDWLDQVLLSLEERAMLESLFIEGSSVAELANQHKISLAGMKKRRERLLKKVKAQLQGKKGISINCNGVKD